MDDAISRSAVHIVINSQIFDTEYPSELDELERQINDIPALDAVPVVHARWIRPAPVEDRIDAPHCSNCGKKAILAAGWFGNYKFTPYCPYCGARMDGE